MTSQDRTYHYMAEHRGMDVVKALDDWDAYLAREEELSEAFASLPEGDSELHAVATELLNTQARGEAMRLFAVRTARRAGHWALMMEDFKHD